MTNGWRQEPKRRRAFQRHEIAAARRRDQRLPGQLQGLVLSGGHRGGGGRRPHPDRPDRDGGHQHEPGQLVSSKLTDPRT